MSIPIKKIEYLVVDTTAFIQNAPLQNAAENIITCQEVIDEITNKRQLRRLVVLPYDLQVKNVFPENIKAVTEFSKKTGDYASLSATDIKVMALTYQLEKEKVGTNHLRSEPLYKRDVNFITHKKDSSELISNIAGFFIPKDGNAGTNESDEESDEIEEENEINVTEENDKIDSLEDDEINITEDDIEVLKHKFESLDCKNIQDFDDVLQKCEEIEEIQSDSANEDDDDDDSGWITPSNIAAAKKQLQSEEIEEKEVKVACMTTDFAMQNVLKQLNLNVSALDGRMIKQLRTFILRCYSCFKTTSVMTKQFCPKCGNDTLKKVAVSLDENGKMQIHINAKRPLTARGKKYSLPRIKGGKHPNNPILVADQPMPDNKPSRLARTRNNPMDDDYIAGFSPFVMRDVNSKSAQLCIRPGQEIKYWMRKNPNEARRRRK
ncbi:hypothetical protein HHI36_003830 [Cryptolaemus montrouzieri]|uniref:RNA-binding protein NOB1 n=1 Tax=Cryptolaemus montrouzieri TaxID=559131 RepID=A0ABD2NPT8_9CUCU